MAKKQVTKEDVQRILANIEKNYNVEGIREAKKAERVSKYEEKLRKGRVQSDKRRERRKKVQATAAGKVTPTARDGVSEPAGRQGRSFSELDEETRKVILQADKANFENVQLGGKVKKKESTFNRVIDVLSRGMYGSAEGLKDANEEYAERRFAQKGKRAAKADFDVSDFIGAMAKVPEGFVQGFTGKEKTSFSDVIQSGADNKKAIAEGRAPSQSLEGEAKVNPFLKHGAGFVADVALDPTTYMGVGLISKAATGGRVLSSKKAAEGLEKTATSVGRAIDLDKSVTPQAIRDGLMVSRAPVERITRKDARNLSPQARQLFDTIKAERKGMNFKRKGAGETQALNKKVSGSGSRAYVNLSGFKGTKTKAIAETRASKELTDYPGLHQIIKNIRHIDRSSLAKKFADVGGLSMKRGTVRLAENLENPGWIRSALDGLAANRNATSVQAKAPEDLIDYIVTHEIGHQAGYLIPKNKREELFARLNDKFEGTLQANTLGEKSIDSPEEMFAEAWAEFRIMGDKARPVAKEIGQFMEPYLKVAPPDVKARQFIEQLADNAANAAKLEAEEAVNIRLGIDGVGRVPRATRKAAAKLTEKELAARGMNAVGKKALQSDLIATMARNLNPEIQKQFKIKLGPTAIAVPGVVKGVEKATQKVGSIHNVERVVKWWNDTFRANAHIPESIGYLRNKANALGSNVIREYTRELQRVFDRVPVGARRDVWKAIKDGAADGVTTKGGISAFNNQPVDNVAKYVDDELSGLEQTIRINGMSNDELNSWLPDKYKITGTKFADQKKVVRYNKNGSKVETTERDVNPTRIREALFANDAIDDPVKMLHYMHSAVNQTIAKRTMWKTATQQFGVPIVKTEGAGPLAKALQKDGWRTTNIKNREIQDVLFHPEIARGLERFDEIFANAATRDRFLDQADRATQTFKAVVTKYNPSFHTRTLLGEVLLGYMGGMRNTRRSYATAAKVLHGSNQEFFGPGLAGQQASRRIVQGHNVLRGMGESGKLADAAALSGRGGKPVMHTKFGPLTADQVRHYYMNSGLKQGYAATELVRGVDAQVGRNLTKQLSRGSTAVTEGVEDFGRMAHFIDVLHHTKARTLEDAIQEAAEIVSKFHLDYTAVTHFEKTWATRVIPFYKWLRLSTPLVAEILLTQPGKAIVMPKAMQAISGMAGYETMNPDAIVPEWLRDQGAVPMMHTFGNTQYFNPQSIFPLSSAVESTTSNPLNFTNPIPLGIIEMLSNKSVRHEGNGPRGSKEDLFKYLAGQAPQTRMAYQVAPGGVAKKRDPGVHRAQTLLSFLTNPGFQPNTEKYMRGEAYNMKEEAYNQRLKQHGDVEARTEKKKKKGLSNQ